MDPELLTAEPPQPSRPSPPGRRRGRYVAAGALVAGGVAIGAIFSPVGLAGAQSDDPSAPDESSGGDDADGTADSTRGDEAQDESGRDGHHGPHLFGLRQSFDDLAETLGLSSEELQAQLMDGKSLADVAEAQGVAVEEVTAQLLGDLDTRLDEAVDEGKVDAEKADELRAMAEERIGDLVNGELPAPPEGGRHGGRDGHGPGFGPGGGFGVGFGQLQELAESLGLSLDDIRTGLEAGKSPAEIAAEAGVSEDELVAALVTAATGHIDEAVEAGRLDADRAAELKADLEERISELVNTAPGDLGPMPAFGPGGRHGDGDGDGPGHHRFGDGSVDGRPADDGSSDDGSAGDGSADEGGADDGSSDDEGEVEGSSLTF